MCQQLWLYPEWLFCCCASVHMIWSNENRCCHNICARLYFVDLSSKFKKPACKKTQIFGGLHFFWLFAPYSHGTSLHPKQQGKQPLGNFPQAVPECREESSQLAQILCKNSFRFLYNCLPRPACIFLFTAAFFCFFLHICPFYTCLSLHRHVSGTTRRHKYLWICILPNGFTMGMFISKFSHVRFRCTFG